MVDHAKYYCVKGLSPRARRNRPTGTQHAARHEPISAYAEAPAHLRSGAVVSRAYLRVREEPAA